MSWTITAITPTWVFAIDPESGTYEMTPVTTDRPYLKVSDPNHDELAEYIILASPAGDRLTERVAITVRVNLGAVEIINFEMSRLANAGGITGNHLRTVTVGKLLADSIDALVERGYLAPFAVPDDVKDMWPRQKTRELAKWIVQAHDQAEWRQKPPRQYVMQQFEVGRTTARVMYAWAIEFLAESAKDDDEAQPFDPIPVSSEWSIPLHSLKQFQHESLQVIDLDR